MRGLCVLDFLCAGDDFCICFAAQASSPGTAVQDAGVSILTAGICPGGKLAGVEYDSDSAFGIDGRVGPDCSRSSSLLLLSQIARQNGGPALDRTDQAGVLLKPGYFLRLLLFFFVAIDLRLRDSFC